MKSLVKEKLLLYKVKIKKDPDAFAQLYDFYVEPIYRFVYFKLSNKEDAEDITSEVFLKTWDYLIQNNKDVGNFRQLVYTIARNKIIDVYRERAKRLECPIETVQEAMLTDNLNKMIETNEAKKELLLIIKKLKNEYQEVIHLKYIEGLKIKDIAAILNKNHTSVRVMIHRATKKLKELSEANSK